MRIVRLVCLAAFVFCAGDPLASDGSRIAAAEGPEGDGWISLSCSESHVLWPDTKSFARYNFSPGDDPGAEFMKAIGPGLKATSMDNWGVLAALSIVLAKYSNQIGEDASQLSHRPREDVNTVPTSCGGLSR